ncbi:hypothetical protein ACO0K0_02355 [Undibacterium sp. SXout11W]|uniref:hypothetical protein n=1 Tax=Undibacterium sp. SXout11W TaxID=3413050 RepID=UPI003BF2124B
MNYLLIVQTFISLFQTLAGMMPQSTTQEKFEATIVGVQGVVGDVTSLLPALSGLATSVDTAIAAASGGGSLDFKLLVGTAMNLIKNVEELMPDSAGADKFNAVIAGLNTLVGDVSAFVPQLEVFATTAVNALRAVGSFKTASSAADAGSVSSLSNIGSPSGLLSVGRLDPALTNAFVVPAVQTSAQI